MTDFMLAASCFLTGSWSMLTSVIYPGTNMTIAQILIGAALIVFGLKLVGKHKDGG